MAFVTLSKRITNFQNESTSIGPGEYENIEFKNKAKLLHKLSDIYIHRKKEIKKIPFNSTSQKNCHPYKKDNYPGPGTYTIINYRNKINKILPLNNQIIIQEENGQIVPQLKHTINGFLSTVNRFNPISPKYETNLGPGYYETERIPSLKLNRNKRIKKARLSDNKIVFPSIPNKTRLMSFENGVLVEKKLDTQDKNEVGKRENDIYPKKNKNHLERKSEPKKDDKITMFNNQLIKDLIKSRDNQNNIDEQKIPKINNKIIKNKINFKIKNLVFKRYTLERNKIHMNTITKLKAHKEHITDEIYEDTPGPGYYESGKNRTIDLSSSNNHHNFGSNSPKFSRNNNDNDNLGPGYYFNDKNNAEQKHKICQKNRSFDKKFIKIGRDIGEYIRRNREKNESRSPGVGKYELGKGFIKKEISNVKSFGILSERFQNAISFDQNFIQTPIKKTDINNNNIINNYKNEINKKINQNYFIDLKIKEEQKKQFEEQNRKKPDVGEYSPERITSLFYKVLSTLNPLRNKKAPFNISNTRFKYKYISRNKKKIELPGPGNYDVSKAYKSLSEITKKYKVFGIGEKNLRNNNQVPGPGLYGGNSPDLWNKKSFNIIFNN